MENGDRPATKKDLDEVRLKVDELGTRVDELGLKLEETASQLRSEFQHGFDDLKETMRDGQTELLRAFYSFATSADPS